MTIKKSISILALAATTAGTLSGCAPDISSSSYDVATIGETKKTYKGQVLSARIVEVKSKGKGGGTAGALAGGLAGAIGGSNIGGGSKAPLAAAAGLGILGAAAGGLIGSKAEKKLNDQKGAEYVVELESGKLRTVVQGLEPSKSNPSRLIAPGTPVLLMESSAHSVGGGESRARIVPYGG